MFFIEVFNIAKKFLGTNNYKLRFKQFKATFMFVLINLKY